MRARASYFPMFGGRRKRMRNFCTAVLYKQVENSFRARRAKEAFSSDDAMSCAIARYLNCDFRTNKRVFCTGLLYARAPRGGKWRLNPNFVVTPLPRRTCGSNGRRSMEGPRSVKAQYIG